MMRRLKLAASITLRSAVIGLATGTVMGSLSGLGFGYAIFWGFGLIGAALGLGLGIVGGLLLAVVTAVFFYPLRQVWLYRAIAPTIGAVVAGSGAAAWGPWYFSSISMTPLSAVTIGLGSVLAALIAGWAGVLAAQDMVRWYECWWYGRANPVCRLHWLGVALLAFFGTLRSYLPLRWLVCGTADVLAVVTCLPSPRLYTSVIAGFKVTLPIMLVIMLMLGLFKECFKRARQG